MCSEALPEQPRKMHMRRDEQFFIADYELCPLDALTKVGGDDPVFMPNQDKGL